MTDRDVTVTFTMKASQVETVRDWCARYAEFTKVAYGYAHEIGKVLSKDEASPEDGEALAKLVQGLHDDAFRADMLRTALIPVLKTGIVSDPEGRKGPLQ